MQALKGHSSDTISDELDRHQMSQGFTKHKPIYKPPVTSNSLTRKTVLCIVFLGAVVGIPLYKGYTKYNWEVEKNIQAEEMIVDLEKDVARLEKSVEAGGEDLKKKKEEVVGLRLENEKLVAEKELVTKTKDDLEGQLEELKKTHTETLEKLSAKEGEKAKLVQKLSVSEGEKATLVQKLSVSEGEKATLVKKNGDLAKQMEKEKKKELKKKDEDTVGKVEEDKGDAEAKLMLETGMFIKGEVEEDKRVAQKLGESKIGEKTEEANEEVTGQGLKILTEKKMDEAGDKSVTEKDEAKVFGKSEVETEGGN